MDKLTKMYVQEEQETAQKKKSKAPKSPKRKRDAGITARRKAAVAARVAKRKAYWKSPEGQARKEAKMNTPEKIEKRAASKLARDQRRRDRATQAKLTQQEEARVRADETLKR